MSKAVKKMTPEQKAKLKQYPEYNELETLKPWHTIMIIRKYLYGEPWKLIAKDLNRNEGSLSQIASSPAGKRLREHLDQRFEDPVELVKSMAAANTLGVATDWYMALEWAKDARDYDSVARMAKDLAALGGVQATAPKQQIEETRTVKIVLDTDTLDTESVEADFTIIEDEDDDDDFLE